MQTLVSEQILSLFTSFETLAYLLAGLLFILALANLSKQKTALRGNKLGIAGMTLALVAVILVTVVSNTTNPLMAVVLLVVALLIGAAIGTWKARSVQMTEMPQLVAMLHSFVGAAAVLVGFNSFITTPGAVISDPTAAAENAFHMGEVGIAVFIGAVTLTGSIIAYLKLAGKISGKPLTLPGRNAINLLMLVAIIACIAWLVNTKGLEAGIITVVSLVLGFHLVMAIGGGDMPVVVSMLNSYSGWAAAMAGFTLGNDLLIITGALVGSSGAYLSYIMCKGMNRNFISVILGGFGSDGSSTGGAATTKAMGSYTTITPEELAEELKAAKSVVICPGYGMAVAQAQFPVAEMTHKLMNYGVDVKFAIHPVAGRMPGHMNVLLAKAKVPYDAVLEMDEINEDFDEVDIALVIGANDTVNPSALTDPNGPIAGMPVLKVWEAGKVVVSKRTMGNAGYSGVENPLFYNDNTDMLLGDAKVSVDAIVAAL